MSNSREIVVRINDKCQPDLREDLYESGLSQCLEELDIGRITGGGTHVDDDGRVAYCEIAIELKDTDDQHIATVIDALEDLGAPHGSKVLASAELEAREFGSFSGLAISIPLAALPSGNAFDAAVEGMLDEIDTRLLEDGELHGWFRGNVDLEIYAYGPDFAAIKACLLDLIDSNPFCRQMRLMQIA